MKTLDEYKSFLFLQDLYLNSHCRRIEDMCEHDIKVLLGYLIWESDSKDIMDLFNEGSNYCKLPLLFAYYLITRKDNDKKEFLDAVYQDGLEIYRKKINDLFSCLSDIYPTGKDETIDELAVYKTMREYPSHL